MLFFYVIWVMRWMVKVILCFVEIIFGVILEILVVFKLILVLC